MLYPDRAVAINSSIMSVPEKNRTSGPEFRKFVLYPTELRGRDSDRSRRAAALYQHLAGSHSERHQAAELQQESKGVLVRSGVEGSCPVVVRRLTQDPSI